MALGTYQSSTRITPQTMQQLTNFPKSTPVSSPKPVPSLYPTGMGPKTATPLSTSSTAQPKTSTISRDLANQQANAFGFYQGAYGFDPITGTTAEGALQRANLNNQIGMQLGNKQYQSGLLNQDYQTGLAQLGLRQQGLGIDQGALVRQLASGGYFDQLGNLIESRLGNQKEGANLSADVSTRKQTSESIAGGSQQTLGNRQGLSDIQSALKNQLSGFDIGAQGERVSLTEQRAKARDQQRQLELTGKDYGLQKDQLKTALDRGLANLGLNSYITINDLMDKVNSSNAQDRMVGQQIIQQVMQNSGMFSTSAPKPTSGATGTKTASHPRTLPGSHNVPWGP